MKRILAFLFLVLHSPDLTAQRTEHVVIAVLDGARYSETFGDTARRYIPMIWSQLRPQGMIFTSYYNNNLTETNPGHASILTGAWENISNDGAQRPTRPTVFEYYAKQLGQAVNYVVLGKTKLNILSYGTFPGYGSPYGASVMTSASQYDDGIAFSNFQSALNNHPKLMIVNLPYTDNMGHSGNWNNYVNALKAADTHVNNIWNAIQADVVMKNNTTLFVTNDHGRHDDAHGGFQNHGDGCQGCRHIFLLVIGPDTPAGVVDSSAREQIDVAPTIGALMRFSTPESMGKVITPAIVTSVGSLAIGLPERYLLHQNYPNPFNPTTVIGYQLPVVSHLKLAVFDVLGREVTVLVNETKARGNYTVEFNASAMASGIYFYTLQARPVEQLQPEDPSARSKTRDGSSGSVQSFVQTKRFALVK